MAPMVLFVIHLLMIGINAIESVHSKKQAENDIKTKLKSLEEENLDESTETIFLNENFEIVPLDASDFDKIIYKSSVAWLVQFYNTSNANWIHFQSSWTDLADSIYNWQKIVLIAMVNCTDEKNVQLCQTYEILDYPTFRYFPPQLESFDIGKTIPTNVINFTDGYTTLINLRIEIIKCLQSTKNRISNWPDFSPLDSENFESILNASKDRALIVVVENNTSYVGRQLMMDLWGTRNVTVRCTFNGSLWNANTTIRYSFNSSLLWNASEELPQAFILHPSVGDKINASLISPITNTSRYMVFKIVQYHLKGLGYVVPDFREPKEPEPSEYIMKITIIDNLMKRKGTSKEDRFTKHMFLISTLGVPPFFAPLFLPEEYKPLLSVWAHASDQERERIFGLKNKTKQDLFP